MNQPSQFAMHPDADQLTAFAEQALPAHEREETLAHLADCAECRRLVFLAQEAVPVEAVAAAEPARRRWFAGWNLVWPAAAALAGTVALAVHLRTVTKPVERVTMADAVTVTAPQVQTETESAEVAAAPKPVAKLEPPKVSAALPRPAETVEGKETGGVATGTLDGAGLARGAGVSPTVTQGSVSQGGPMQQQQYLPQVQSQTQNQFTAAAPPKPVPQVSAAAPSVKVRDTAVLAAPMAAPAPPPPPAPVSSIALGRAASQGSVEASAAGAAMSVDALSDDASYMALPAMVLPSHLAATSTAASGGRTLAIDAKGGVFLSTDGGRHWKAVKAAWAGRVVQVSTGPLVENVAAIRPGALAGRAAKRAVSSDRAELDGVVTDRSGAAVAKASVKATAVATGSTTATRSDDAGEFTLIGLAPGEYRVEVTMPGFMVYTEQMTLSAGESKTMRAELRVGVVSQTVTVTEEDAESKKMKKAAPEPAFALKTDTGAVWVSVDGKKWKRQ